MGELDGESNQVLKDEIIFSYKGNNKSRFLKLTEDPMAMYKSVLESGTSYSSENAGFRCRNGKMWTKNVGSKIKTDTQWYNVQDGVMESIMKLKILETMTKLEYYLITSRGRASYTLIHLINTGAVVSI